MIWIVAGCLVCAIGGGIVGFNLRAAIERASDHLFSNWSWGA